MDACDRKSDRFNGGRRSENVAKTLSGSSVWRLTPFTKWRRRMEWGQCTCVGFRRQQYPDVVPNDWLIESYIRIT